MTTEKKRFAFLDALKGFAIISVVLYHFGGDVLPYGYFGVDVFFVISGYLLIKQLDYQIKSQSFHYWSFIKKKICRLLPPIMLLAAISIAIGFFFMLPDDYENLSESVIASGFFSNNILECITTKNYWNIRNLYKPLMHLWYIGVLMQAYIVVPLIYLLANKLLKNQKNKLFICTLALTLTSLALYLFPSFSSTWKFYLLPFRLYEITTGGIISYLNVRWSQKTRRNLTIVLWVLLITIISIRQAPFNNSILLLIFVVLTSIIILCSYEVNIQHRAISTTYRLITRVGRSSYSIYVCHQAIVAFLFYSFFQTQNLVSFIAFVLLTTIVSVLIYHFVEVPIEKTIHNGKATRILIMSITALMLVSVLSAGIYKNAGVVRDVPELDISKDNIQRNMHAAYSDRPYQWNHEFENNGKLHLLVLGNSYGRDWSNVLYEWNPELDISYLYYVGEGLSSNAKKVEMADVVFFTISGDGVPKEVTEMIPEEKLFIVGNKQYGESNGIIYANRNRDDYYSQTVQLPIELSEQNNYEANLYGEHYIDMLAPLMTEDGRIRVFTSDNKFVSQDCRHLTRAGARYYASLLNSRIKQILNN